LSGVYQAFCGPLWADLLPIIFHGGGLFMLTLCSGVVFYVIEGLFRPEIQSLLTENVQKALREAVAPGVTLVFLGLIDCGRHVPVLQLQITGMLGA